MEAKIEKAKRSAALAATAFVKEGMRIGLGTGSTSALFIQALAAAGTKIEALATSKATAQLAEKLGIPLIDEEKVTELDLVVDGADEVDIEMQLIKGGGGALLREKIVASISREMIVIVDETKCVESLGGTPLPVEVIPFCWRATQKQLQDLGFSSSLRGGPRAPFVTDNNNLILDLQVKGLNPSKTDQQILKLPGVVETGYFLGLATRILVGHFDGTVQNLG